MDTILFFVMISVIPPSAIYICLLRDASFSLGLERYITEIKSLTMNGINESQFCALVHDHSDSALT